MSLRIPDSYSAQEAEHIQQLSNALGNPSRAMVHFSAEGLYDRVGKSDFNEKLRVAISDAFKKASAT